MNALLEQTPVHPAPSLRASIESACGRIAPLWSLTNFVAVNPFLGLTDRPFIEACRLMQRAGHGEMLMPADYYIEQIRSGRLEEADLQEALKVASEGFPLHWARHISLSQLAELGAQLAACAKERPSGALMTFAEFVDANSGSAWAAFVVEEISKWCSAYFDQGQSSWRMPWRDQRLYCAWKFAALLDANPHWAGLKSFWSRVGSLPESPLELIDAALEELGVPSKLHGDFLHRQLMSVAGWAGFAQCRAKEASIPADSDTPLIQLMAIRLAYDLALLDHAKGHPHLLGKWREHLDSLPCGSEPFSPGLLARSIAQLALELAYQRKLLASLDSPRPKASGQARKSLQAVFCIDVRSEVYRRALESRSDEIETLGFAGFFGMPIEHVPFGNGQGNAYCPVLLKPKFKVREVPREAGAAGVTGRLLRRMDFLEQASSAWNAFKTSAISCYSFVETLGPFIGLQLVRDSLLLRPSKAGFASARKSRQFALALEPEAGGEGHESSDITAGIPLSERVALAAGALKNMGLVDNFAQVVLFCGHASASANNPYGSALDCGACGGHAGDTNARVAATILNQTLVREGLKAEGIVIPEETVFIAGLHNTATDEVLIYEDETLSAKQAAELEKIKDWLGEASSQARRERAGSFGLSGGPGGRLDREILARSRDWSQVRPEWGLAGNAAFIAAPRERTRGLDLEGRVFLHEYDSSRDRNLSTLELILSAPVVVASWINLQYYGSTVDNRRFGSGNKAIHNVVGTFGVWQGNGGDLQTGLPLQSLHDGTRWVHEPLRLSVFVEASRSDIETVLSRQPKVRELFDNGWLHLIAIEEEGRSFHRYQAGEFESLRTSGGL